MRALLRLAALTLCLLLPALSPADAQNNQQGQSQGGRGFTPDEIVRTGHKFFGTVSRGLAEVVEAAFSKWGQPNGYVLGQEGGGAFVVGPRYRDRTVSTKKAR